MHDPVVSLCNFFGVLAKLLLEQEISVLKWVLKALKVAKCHAHRGKQKFMRDPKVRLKCQLVTLRKCHE